MAKTTAPLLGFGASGQIAKTQVYSKWKGRLYARKHVVPANPRTTAQTATRTAFTWLMAVWKLSPSLWQDVWNAYATGQVLTGRNAMAKFNISNLRTATDITDLVFSPGAKGGLAPTSITVTPGAGQLQVAPGVPSLPVGWTIASATAIAIASQDPTTDELYQSFAQEATATPWSPTITGLTASTAYEVGVYFKFQKPDGSFAYGTALQSTGTPT